MSDNEIVRLRLIAEYEEKFGPILPEAVSPDSIGHHKASHAALMCMGMIERHLKLDPVVLSDPELFQHTQDATLALVKLYSKFDENRFEEWKSQKKRNASNMDPGREATFTQFDAADYLHSEEDFAEFIDAAKEDGNPKVLVSAQEDAAKARARMSASKK